jgi:hypothetical protein
VVQDVKTKKCTIVDKRPTNTETVIVGDGKVYTTRAEAETGMKTVKVSDRGAWHLRCLHFAFRIPTKHVGFALRCHARRRPASNSKRSACVRHSRRLAFTRSSACANDDSRLAALAVQAPIAPGVRAPRQATILARTAGARQALNEGQALLEGHEVAVLSSIATIVGAPIRLGVRRNHCADQKQKRNRGRFHSCLTGLQRRPHTVVAWGVPSPIRCQMESWARDDKCEPRPTRGRDQARQPRRCGCRTPTRDADEAMNYRIFRFSADDFPLRPVTTS